MEKFELIIDGKAVTAAPGQSVLEAALAAGIYIPHLCWHPDLVSAGECGLCVVEAEGAEKPLRACVTEAKPGMRITTKSARLDSLRGVAMELMLAGHPHDCTSCKAYMNCELQALMQYLGTVHARMRDVPRTVRQINPGDPLIVRENERCVQCGRCVRACGDRRGVEALSYAKQDGEVYVHVDSDVCRYCGACVEVCPTGALQDVEGVFRRDVPREQAMVPCSLECPAHTDIPAYIRAIRAGEYSRAVGIIREKLPFPGALGAVCSRKCEAACKREKLNEAVSIRELKLFAAQNDTEQVWRGRGFQKPDTGKRVAVIGAGPAGLTAALYLRKCGHSVTVLERLPVPGGMMTTGIPAYRLPRDLVDGDIDLIRQQGVEIRTGVNVENAPALKEEYDAVLVAVGAAQGKKLNLPGAEAENAYAAVDVLRESRLSGRLPAEAGARAVIIGGGNVAYDCARTLARCGVEASVVCLEKEADMPADREEIEEGRAEGVRLYDGYTTQQLTVQNGRVTGVRIVGVDHFSFGEGGRLELETDPERTADLAADVLIFAAGQTVDLTADFGLELNRFGYPVYSGETMETSVPGIFAAGDVVTGTRFVIDAVAAGRRVAQLIDRYLGGDGCIEETLVPRTRPTAIGREDGFTARQRCTVSDGEAAACEAGRCLQCDLRCDMQKVQNWNAYK